MNRALVLDGRALSSLAVVRSLGAMGYRIDVGESFRLNLTSFSKYVDNRFVYPDPEDAPNRFIGAVISRLQEVPYDIVLPTRDATTQLIATYQDQINEYANTYVADGEVLDVFMDKGETIKLADELGIPTPPTFFPEEMALEELSRQVSYPALIRPRRSAGSRGITRVDSKQEITTAFHDVAAEYGTPMVQQYVEKTGYTTACLLLDGDQREVASFSYERIKEYPLSGGPTVVGRSTHDTEAIDYARRLLSAGEWKGVAEVEFIRDRAGVPRLLEVNPRFWTPVQLAITAGVDFPKLVTMMATGDEVDRPNVYEKGLTYRWILPNEILHTVKSGNLLEGVGQMLRSPTENTCYGVLSLEDPGPTVGTLAQSVAFLADQEKRKLVLDRAW